MSKKRSAPPKNHVAADFQSTRDEMMRDLPRLLGSQEFGSLDDVNAFLQREVMGKPLRRVEPTTDRERAEDLVMAAREERSLPKMRAKIAQALALDADCVGAHVLLAELADSPPKALAHYRDAIAAGDRVLKDELADGGALWYHPGARPYLQARHLCAELMWQTGDRQLALDEARTILRLNAGDNQGVRYILIEWLMRAGSVAEIDALLSAYDEHTAAWAFSLALHRYRTLGPVAEATKALRAAMNANIFVAPMLLGDVPFPAELPDTYGIGDESEAALYVDASIATWFDAVGAIEWLRRQPRAKPAAKSARRTRR